MKKTSADIPIKRLKYVSSNVNNLFQTLASLSLKNYHSARKTLKVFHKYSTPFVVLYGGRGGGNLTWSNIVCVHLL